MEYQLVLENIKCGGCANSIRNKVIKESGVEDVHIDFESGTVRIIGGDAIDIDSLKHKLALMGYPEEGTGTGFQKAKSYVSCMIGRIAPES